MNQLILLIMLLTSTGTLTLSSPAFRNKGDIPEKYTCAGSNVSPEIQIGNIPSAAKSLALIVDDPDAPGSTFDHWIMWNIPVTDKIAENSSPGTQGLNGKKENKYCGPCPPKGLHHYHFRVYALDAQLDIPAKSDKAALMKAMEGHILASGKLVGTFKK
jgi:hypothetical protein